MNQFKTQEEALHAMLMHYKPRHWDVLCSIHCLGGEEGVVLPNEDMTVLQQIIDESFFKASVVTEAVNELEEGGLIEKCRIKLTDGKVKNGIKLINPSLYHNELIGHLLDCKHLWWSKDVPVFQSESWNEALTFVKG